MKKNTIKAAAVFMSAAVMLASMVPVSAASAPVISGSTIAEVTSAASKTLDVKAAVGETAYVTVSVKTDKKPSGILIEYDGTDTGLYLNESLSKAVIKGDGINVIITKNRASVLFPQEGYDCSKGVELISLAFSAQNELAAEKGAVSIEVLEIYDTVLKEIDNSAVTYDVKNGSTEQVHRHMVVIDPAVEATCTSEGKTEGSHCSSCGEILEAQQVIPKKAHTPVTDAAVAADCTREGKTEGSHCSVCGEIITAQQTIPKTAHTVVTDAAVAADCTREGKTEGSHCSVCGEIITAQQTVPKTAHTYTDGVCTQCGEK